MAKKSGKKKSEPQMDLSGPWIKMRTGIIIIAITSIAMAVLTTITAMDTKPFLEAVFWGILFGAFIWAIFLGMLFFNRLMGRR